MKLAYHLEFTGINYVAIFIAEAKNINTTIKAVKGQIGEL